MDIRKLKSHIGHTLLINGEYERDEGYFISSVECLDCMDVVYDITEDVPRDYSPIPLIENRMSEISKAIENCDKIVSDGYLKIGELEDSRQVVVKHLKSIYGRKGEFADMTMGYLTVYNDLTNQEYSLTEKIKVIEGDVKIAISEKAFLFERLDELVKLKSRLEDANE